LVSAEMVKELRQITGAGFLDCKKALTEANGDVNKAADLLREKGLAAAAKKAGRVTAEGAVTAYIHGNGKIGVLVEVNCETDFVGKNHDFQAFSRDIAMHIAASSPRYISRDEVSPQELEHERTILLNQTINEGKKPEIAEKIVSGRMEKFYQEICLLEQPFVKDPDITVEKYVQQKVSQFGENISVRRFVRFVMGEGLEKKEDNFVAEVAKLQKRD